MITETGISIITSSGITVGTDAEVMLKDQAGQFVSGVGIIPGYKNDPVKTEHGWIQSDNVNAEFNIPPASTAEEFDESISNVLGDLWKIVDVRNLSLAIESAAFFPWDELQTYQAQLAGCDPDYNFWILSMNNPPDLSETNLRTASAHIHVGHPDGPKHFKEFRKKGFSNGAAKIIQAMDLFLGVPSVLLDDGSLRKSLYGKAGCGRYKPYGVEHRTMSNFWIKTSALRRWVFNNTVVAYDNHKTVGKMLKKYDVQECINNNDKAQAELIINAFGIPMP